MTSTALPVCITSKDLVQHDGQQVRLIGVYRKIKSQKPNPKGIVKMRPNSSDMGYWGKAEIELLGDHKDYRPDNWASAPPTVVLGMRPDGENDRCHEQLVTIEGTLDLDPYRHNRESTEEPVPAMIVWGDPELRNASNATLAGPEDKAAVERASQVREQALENAPRSRWSRLWQWITRRKG